ncbi:hypothetical protein BDV96DRAFT_647091 [Lophiotrema nucula]|uniref:Uncharacterized protein n=1 Tax=Lophiotrema nucula TaxID=690887 RepID=A0A6A5Z4N6_9PLEO|nr:hypothetical protein BDV96DRAFT_647091 [Lophiotrema nucula]
MASYIDDTNDFDTWFGSLANDGLSSFDVQAREAPEQFSPHPYELDSMTAPFATSPFANFSRMVTTASLHEHGPSLADWVPDWASAVGPANGPENLPRHLADIALPLPSTADEQPARKRKQQPRIPAEAKALLQEQFAKSPYPAADELAHLAERTGLPINKVRNWFSNTRSRQDERNISQGSKVAASAARIPLTRRSLEKLSQESQCGQLQPMEAWASSSLQSEAPSVSAIEAAADYDYENGSTIPTLDFPKASRTPSIISSMASSAASSLASASTSYSMSSRGSFASGRSTRSRRRGRRTLETRQEPHIKSKQESTQRKSRSVYWCTFAACNKRISTHYEWGRHEESIHVPRHTWICCLDDDSSLMQDRCRTKEEESRTFFRQDQFIQHLHGAHFSGLKHPLPDLGCTKGSSFGCAALVERWRRPAPPLEKNDPLLYCGFCGLWLSTWEERRSHVADHFKKEKKRMSAWQEHRAPLVLPDARKASEGPVRCRYCCQVFENWRLHKTCLVWSCRFPENRDPEQHPGLFLFIEEAFSSDRRMMNHLQDIGVSYFFNNEGCGQPIYRSAEDFFQHLGSSHKASSTCRSYASTFAKLFRREKHAVFEAVPSTVQKPPGSPSSLRHLSPAAIVSQPASRSRLPEMCGLLNLNTSTTEYATRGGETCQDMLRYEVADIKEMDDPPEQPATMVSEDESSLEVRSMHDSDDGWLVSEQGRKGERFYCTGFPGCTLSFTRPEHLARHMRKHTGERPFQCHCSRRFTSLDKLRQHAQIVHTDEDIFENPLAATGARFHRRHRTERVRANSLARQKNTFGKPLPGEAA